MTLGGVGLSMAPKIALTKRPLSIFDRTLSTIFSNEGDFIIAIQWLGHPSHKYNPLAASFTTLFRPESIKKSLPDLRNDS